MRYTCFLCCLVFILLLFCTCSSSVNEDGVEIEASIALSHTEDIESSSSEEPDSGIESNNSSNDEENTLPYEGTGIVESTESESDTLPARGLTIKLIDMNDEPVVNAMLYVNNSNVTNAMFTNADGENTMNTEVLEVSDIYTFRVQMMRPNGDFVYEDISIKIDILKNENPIIVKLSSEKIENEYMTLPNRVEILFVNQDNTPIPNVWCSIGRANEPAQPSTYNANDLFLKYGFSNSDGKRYLSGLAYGDYVINANVDGGSFQATFSFDSESNNNLIICEIGTDSMMIHPIN